MLQARFGKHRVGFKGLPKDMPLFPAYDGGRFSIGKQHDNLLNDCIDDACPKGLLYVDGRRMSLSSWRHTYASEMIEAFAQSRTPNMVTILARNMGTTEKMIDQYYGHLLPSFAKERLRI
ncbi:hypothetical protein [Terricaulis silvestris]|uniref:hypothetical protein n=1 Tax=Terricaulis silvestris TaxID=2686094 RepID=UPI00131ACDC9|nr:hypothetical protein [Terricaulis silvestris]